MDVKIYKIMMTSAGILLAAFGMTACQTLGSPQEVLEAANMEKAIYCMDLLENKQDIARARKECFAETYIQHTPRIEDGREAVLAYFAARFKAYPDFGMEIKRASADGDLVWMHLHVKTTPDNRGAAVINVFRMKDGKFVEHWNVGQAVPETSKNNNTMF